MVTVRKNARKGQSEDSVIACLQTKTQIVRYLEFCRSQIPLLLLLLPLLLVLRDFNICKAFDTHVVLRSGSFVFILKPFIPNAVVLKRGNNDWNSYLLTQRDKE
jgi:hypothetical protein